MGIPGAWTSGYELDALRQPLKAKVIFSMITYGWSGFGRWVGRPLAMCHTTAFCAARNSQICDGISPNAESVLRGPE